MFSVKVGPFFRFHCAVCAKTYIGLNILRKGRNGVSFSNSTNKGGQYAKHQRKSVSRTVVIAAAAAAAG